MKAFPLHPSFPSWGHEYHVDTSSENSLLSEPMKKSSKGMLPSQLHYFQRKITKCIKKMLT